jgi:hypothetical protein
MSTIKVQASATGTGTVTLTAPVTNSDRTVTLPDQSGTLFMNSTNGALNVDAAAPANSLTVSSTGVIGGNGASLTSLNASNLASGTVPDARFPATLPAASGANLTSLNASNISSGTVPTARLASGTANNTTYLRGDQTWVTVSSNPGTVTSVATGNGLQGGTITSSGTLSVACPTFNTVGSYVFGAFSGSSGATAGSNYSAGGGGGQVGAASVFYNSCGVFQSGFNNQLSGTWKWMGQTIGTVAGVTGLFCRVA